MTAHARSSWQIGQPADDALIEQVATCMNHNRMGYWFTPLCFAILNHADQIITNLSMMVDHWDHETDFAAHAATFGEVPEWFTEIALKVLPKLNLPPPPGERVAKKFPTKFTVPKINRKYPPL